MAPFATDDGSGDGSFHGPSLAEFFPGAFLFAGTPFEINRIMMVRFIAVLVLILLFWVGTRRMRMIPGRSQSLLEMAVGFVQSNIADGALGKEDGKRFMPLLATMFFMVLAMNITGVVPGLNIAGTSVIGVPLVLAVVAYVVFIYAGIKKQGMTFFKASLFPSGVPWALYIIVTPIEFVSTFILRPVTLALRLLMNMIAGHMLLVLCFSATQFFLFTAGGFYGLFSGLTLAFGLIFTLFEILVAVLQAYVFTFLTAVYIQLALVEEH
ncbi:F0F1 ATP synthase subunit A [Salinibacterium amurskyense]|uniref:F0F1 ATP synthase subunit A n=1 Tax=Salinibacterium amurskyense TaxID=205941 RepID=UPI000C2427DB|nr:F0F1 ATP synthase subunit A [Salinibacterium amurskyense]RLQ80216.1 ATP synthase F0 subunit A [Salinibacterium amurskyense]